MFLRNTQHHNLAVQLRHPHCCENLKSSSDEPFGSIKAGNFVTEFLAFQDRPCHSVGWSL
jgi:hypothetical protein